MRLRSLVAAAAMLSASLAAHADTFNFSFSGNGQTGSGSLTAAKTATAGRYLITGATGLIDGFTITSVLAPGTFPVANAGDSPNDNLLFYPGNANTYFDFPGVSFALSNGLDANLFDNGGPVILFGTPAADTSSYSLTSLNIAATPEPSSFALLFTGLLGAAAVVRKRLA